MVYVSSVLVKCIDHYAIVTENGVTKADLPEDTIDAWLFGNRIVYKRSDGSYHILIRGTSTIIGVPDKVFGEYPNLITLTDNVVTITSFSFFNGPNSKSTLTFPSRVLLATTFGLTLHVYCENGCTYRCMYGIFEGEPQLLCENVSVKQLAQHYALLDDGLVYQFSTHIDFPEKITTMSNTEKAVVFFSETNKVYVMTKHESEPRLIDGKTFGTTIEYLKKDKLYVNGSKIKLPDIPVSVSHAHDFTLFIFRNGLVCRVVGNTVTKLTYFDNAPVYIERVMTKSARKI